MSEGTPKYKFAWLVLLLFVFGSLLALLWLLIEVKQTQRQRSFTYPAATNSGTKTNR